MNCSQAFEKHIPKTGPIIKFKTTQSTYLFRILNKRPSGVWEAVKRLVGLQHCGAGGRVSRCHLDSVISTETMHSCPVDKGLELKISHGTYPLHKDAFGPR